ncbi:HNH endonuclease [Evansella cellulosilytica]|uniref:HNH endonuclease n=1 Tax=Evansella cellulosilytica (strain ATCC 21833 / DSM 2522 / FERM P-1141 / JCM 9156 / N-4) TaxID=649639 RepID=E6TT53_EVAC2|nr:HNH endonuclease [Evansella cellulosilytica]ADU31961.1 hypothetical protein Bcell_3721 [Evansella cellulosilytica DSM 2522]
MSFQDRVKKETKKLGEKVIDGAKKLHEKDRVLKETTGKGLVHTTGESVGNAAGFLLGKPLEKVGQRFHNKFFMELGEGIHKSSRFTGGVAGQLGQGAWKTTEGLIRWDGSVVWEGFGEIGHATGRTVVGIGKTAIYTLQNSAQIVKGLYSKDYERVKIGASGVAKVVIIGGIAFTVIDLVDGGNIAMAEEGTFINTHNSSLAGQLHPETGVPFEAQAIALEDGTEVVGVFPVFDAVAEVVLPEELYGSSDYLHFSYANGELIDMVSENETIAAQFSIDQLEQIYAGETPDGYTWHHHEDLGKLELVDEEIHAKTGHSGGRSVWGGGTDGR